MALQGTYTVTADSFATGSLTDKGFITFLSDGTYIFATHTNDSDCPDNGNGVELGNYTWKPVGNVGPISFTARLQQLGDSNTGCGLAPAASDQTITKNADGSLTLGGGGGTITVVPVTFHAGAPIQGPFNVSTSGTTYAPATSENGSTVLILLDSSHFFLVESTGAIGDTSDIPGIEDACYSLGSSGQFAVNFSNTCTTASGQAPIHTAGDGGLMNNVPAGTTLTVTTPETSTQLEQLTYKSSEAQVTLTHIPVH